MSKKHDCTGWIYDGLFTNGRNTGSSGKERWSVGTAADGPLHAKGHDVDKHIGLARVVKHRQRCTNRNDCVPSSRDIIPTAPKLPTSRRMDHAGPEMAAWSEPRWLKYYAVYAQIYILEGHGGTVQPLVVGCKQMKAVAGLWMMIAHTCQRSVVTARALNHETKALETL